MPISEEGKKRQLEALAKARAIRKEKTEALLRGETPEGGDGNPQLDPETIMPQVELKKATVSVSGRILFTTLDNREMTVCVGSNCWVGKIISISDEDCQKAGEKSGKIPSLQSLGDELSRQLKTAGFIFRTE